MKAYMKNSVNIRVRRAAPLLTATATLLFSVLYASGWTSWNDAANVFLVAVFLGAGVYRPKGMFWGMIAFLPLELLNIFPESFPFQVRLYQLSAVSAGIGYVVQLLRKEPGYTFFRVRWQDGALFVFGIFGIVSAFVSGELEAMKLSVIIVSFIYIYGVVRLFVRSEKDIEMAAVYFFGSFFVTALLGIWQNWMFMHGGVHGEFMPGRPNALFSEADWFGMYMALGISFAFALLLSVFEQTGYSRRRILQALTLHESIFFGFVALILSVARSAWLGAVAAFAVFSGAVIFRYGVQQLFGTLSFSAKRIATAVFVFLVAAGFVVGLKLTPFNVFDRLESSGTGLQTITVSCEQPVQLPEVIDRTEDLETYRCRHIPIEQIVSEVQAERIVTEVKRPDPNVAIRSKLWKESFRIIGDSPWIGSGWGEVGRRLGTDENGHRFNASNIFLEAWIGSGAIGFLAFISIIISLGIFGARCAMRSETRVIGAGMLIVMAAIIVPNLFNSGHLIGFFWVWLGVSIAVTDMFSEKSRTLKRIS